MAHVPHVVLREPWEGPIVPLPAETERHLRGVLRLPNGEAVEYTDGEGVRGSGVLGPSGLVRGDEHRVEPPGRLVVAVAPLKAKDRMRFLVEKLTELGVSEVWWLSTRFGQVPAPSAQRVEAWAVGALEQSRGAWLPRVRSAGWPDVVSSGLDAVVCDPSGEARGLPVPGLVVVGPEGGFAADEIPPGVVRASLGPTVLRTETAAIAAAVLARLS
jgi:16S rRNA (uracil1498-N3)-methyltransferase